MRDGLVPPRVLWNVAWRHLLRHAWQSVLMVAGITLGVAVVVAVDLANTSASRAFDLSTEAVAGRATHQIVGSVQGLDEAIYTRLRGEGIVRAAAPIIGEYVSSPQLGDRPLQLLGVDPFAEAPFRDYVAGERGAPVDGLAPFLTQPGAVLLSADTAGRYGLAPGARITLEVGGHERDAVVVGLLQPADHLSRRALDGMLLADIATAQELTGRLGKLDRIDLILTDEGRTSDGSSVWAYGRVGVPEPATTPTRPHAHTPTRSPSVVDEINALLPPSARILPVDARTGAIAQMTAAFRTNLTALSLLALVVGTFLIYNTMTFSVVQRRALFGTLRCLGVTRREIFGLVAGEALVVGAAGAALGLALGLVMGQGVVHLVTRTINDLYFVVTVRGTDVSVVSLAKGAFLGIAVTVLAAALPAWEAASAPPRAALSRSGLEQRAQRAVTWTAAGGLALLGSGAGILLLPTRSLGISFAGTFAVIVGSAMVAPLLTVLLMGGIRPLTGRLWGLLGRMAPRDVAGSLSRTSVAVAALMVAVSVTIGISLMVSSFRTTVVAWLGQTLQGDVYVSAPSVTGAHRSTAIDQAVVQRIQEWPGVARVDTLRAATVDSPAGPVRVAAIGNPSFDRERRFLSIEGPREAVWDALEEGAVAVSEPLANRMRLPRRGGTVALYTERGLHGFPVAGIYYDYASSEGTVTMSLETYRAWWGDEAITALSVRLAPGVDADGVARQMQDSLTPLQRLVIRPNRALRDEVLVVFDRTFAITGALQLLATAVAFVGVLSSLLALQLEKQREFGVLRAVGLTTRQLWGLVMLQTGLIGGAAGLLAMPTGFALSLILIYIINRRAFGWTLQMHVGATPFVQALAIAVLAALLAGLYPAFRMSKTVTAEALRLE